MRLSMKPPAWVCTGLTKSQDYCHIEFSSLPIVLLILAIVWKKQKIFHMQYPPVFPERQQPHTKIHFLIKWKPFNNFFEAFCEDTEFSDFSGPAVRKVVLLVWFGLSLLNRNLLFSASCTIVTITPLSQPPLIGMLTSSFHVINHCSLSLLHKQNSPITFHPLIWVNEG